jgi:acyl carrier protein
MVLADGPFEALDADTLRMAMGAKALGAWNLLRATADRALDHFLLFGSISAQVGNPGQAAYAAANAALDGLAWHRAAAGQPATCVSFGALGEAGVVARDAGTRAHLQSLGLTPMAPRAVFARLDTLLATASPCVTLVDIDWDRWARAVPGSGWAQLDGLLGGQEGSHAAGLSALPPAERRAAVERLVREAAAAVFRMDPDALDAERSLRDQGLDSILAVELAVNLGNRVGVELSAMDLLAGRGVKALAVDLVRRLGLDTEAPVASAAAPTQPDRTTDAEKLLARICVTRPYLSLTGLAVEGDRVVATVVPDTLLGEDRSPVPAGEVGRHLAILGSLAGAHAWPSPGRHAWPVASSTVTVEPGAPCAPGTAFRIEARCVTTDPLRGRAEAEGVMTTLDGRVVGRLRVGYHVLPFDGFLAMFADRALPTDEAGHVAAGTSPYTTPPARPAGPWDGARFTRRLPPLAAADCAGHFAGLPAMPVSILGRHVLGAVLDGMEAAGVATGDVFVRQADLVTERFAWAGEAVELVAEPRGGDPEAPWSCVVRVPAADAVIARFVLDVVTTERGEVAAK